MKSSAGRVSLTAYEDLFKNNEGRADDSMEKITEVPLSELHAPVIHPFKVLEDESMQEMADSILKYGVMTPALVRPRSEGGYEVIAGNRRKRASELAGKETMPVIIRDMDDDSAVILMVDSNMQRETILPSEKAMAYKMKLDALKRKAGRPAKENSVQVGQNFKGMASRELLAENSPDSSVQIQRYIRLTELSPSLLDMVDNKQIPLNPAVELSYLAEKEQAELLEVMTRDEVVPSLSQAQRLKKYSQEGKLDENVIEAILNEEKAIETKVVLRGDTLRKFFPKSYTPKQMEETIVKLLENWHRHRQQEQSR
jgi:ParB family transcriptional regulator, chromosome partitioning protein